MGTLSFVPQSLCQSEQARFNLAYYPHLILKSSMPIVPAVGFSDPVKSGRAMNPA
jgi:hypothetical protein